MTTEELQEAINLYQRIMDGCGDRENSFTLTDAVKGKEPSQKCLEFQALIEKAGLDVGFFSNADPLYARAEQERNRYQTMLEEKQLLQNGISIA